MSKNFTAKTSPKWILWSIISAVLVLVSIIVMAVAGANKSVEMKSSSTLTVSVTLSNTFYEDQKENFEQVAEKAIADAKLEAIDSYAADKSLQLHELVYVFEKDTDLTAVKDSLQLAYDAMDKQAGCTISVMANNNEMLETVAGGDSKYLVSAGIACVVAAVFAFAYVAIRFNLWNGIVTFVAAIASAALTSAVILLARIPVAASTVYTIMISMLLAIVVSVLFAAKNSKAEKDNGALTDAEALSETVPVCDAVKLGGMMAIVAIAVGVIGAFTTVNFVWFAVATLVGVIAAMYASIILAPSVFLALRGVFANLQAARSRYDYKKGKKAKKAEKAVEETAESAE